MSYIKNKSFKIVSRFYVIYGDYEPIYVGYTNRTVKQRFKEHKKDKDFSDYDSVEVKELINEKLSFDFTWDYEQTCKNADKVSLREGQLVQQYGTQDSVFQKAIGGGQTWSAEKWFIKCNKDNPRFLGMSGVEIKKRLKEEKVIGTWLNSFIRNIRPVEEIWIYNFVGGMRPVEKVWLRNFYNDMKPVEELWLHNFTNVMKSIEEAWLGNFVNHMQSVEEAWLGGFTRIMRPTEEVWLGSFVTTMSMIEEVWVKGFTKNMRPIEEVWLNNFVGDMRQIEKIWLISFISGIIPTEEVWLHNFTNNMKLKRR